MRIYKKTTTQHNHRICLTRDEAVRLLNPDDWFVIGKIREKLDGLVNGNSTGESGQEESADRS